MRRYLALLMMVAVMWGCAPGDFEGYKYKPYTVKGVRYEPMHPQDAPGYVEEGVASHYWEGFLFFPGPTALGEHAWPWSSHGAHKTLPLPCKVRVTNLRNGKSVVIRVNDRGPFIAGRTLDVSRPVAKKLGFYKEGLAPVRLEVLSVGDGKWKMTKPRVKAPAPVRVERAIPVTPGYGYPNQPY